MAHLHNGRGTWETLTEKTLEIVAEGPLKDFKKNYKREKGEAFAERLREEEGGEGH